MTTLAESIEYLGTDTATTKLIRKHGPDKIIEETREFIDKIGNSVLALNQKIYSIKTFAIPMLDFILTNGRVSLNMMRDIDTQIRTIINKHVKGTNLPVSLFYTHWKDGGLSFQSLHERALCLRAKAFMALCNSKSEKTRKAMRYFIESERRFRYIDNINEGEDIKFINWRIPNTLNKGTDTITVHALRSSKKLNFTFIIDEETGNIEVRYPIRDYQIHTDNPQIPGEVIGEEVQNEIKIKTPRDLLQQTMRDIRSQHRQKLIDNKGIGHSFIDIKDSAYANRFVGDFTHPLNDNIASWIIKVRCNMLLTGSKAVKIHLPVETSPRCPYCGALGDDTLSHRLNGCLQSRSIQTKRHNNIQNIMLEYMKCRLGRNVRYKTNSTVNLEGNHIADTVASLKPDIIAWNDKEICLVEFSCPYANIGEQGNKLDNTFMEKNNKYDSLVKECKTTYKRKVHLYTIIVSSLGAIQKDSIKQIRKLLHIKPRENKLMNTVLRRISLAAYIGSCFIFNKLKYNEYSINAEDNTNDEEDGTQTNIQKTTETETPGDNVDSFSNNGMEMDEDEGENGNDDSGEEEESTEPDNIQLNEEGNISTNSDDESLQ